MSRPLRESLSEKNLLRRGVPRDYFDAHLDQYPIDPEIRQIVERYIENMEQMLADNIQLVMYGVNGNGKTYLSSLIVKEAYRRRYTSYRVTLASLVQTYFNKGKDEDVMEFWDSVMDCDFLFIDEVGKEAFDSKQYNIAIFEEILRHRDTIARPTSLCTNLPLEEKGGVYDQYGKSIRSLLEGKAVKLFFHGEDYRKDVTSQKKGIQILMGGGEDDAE